MTYPGQRPTPYVAPRHRRRPSWWLIGAVFWTVISGAVVLVALWPVAELVVERLTAVRAS